MILRITAKRDGFCRAGKSHPAEPVDHPDGTFPPEQIKALEAEPMLVVQELPDEDVGEEPKVKEKKDKSGGKEKTPEPPAPDQVGESAPQGESEQAKG